jgi:SAM-dependent methyltransferase
MSRTDPTPRAEAPPGASGEVERIRRVYGAYETDARCRSIWGDTPASRYMKERKWAAIAGVLPLPAAVPAGAWALDLGAGGGSDSLRLTEAARGLGGIVALDLLQERVAEARAAGPALRPVVGDGTRLPLATGSVALVYQSTMISSVLDAALRQAIYAEIRRVLAPGGIFLSYDTRYRNPWNRNTRPVALRELRGAFAGWAQRGHSLTGIPQLLRRLAPRSLLLCRMIEAVPALRSHRLFAARKP